MAVKEKKILNKTTRRQELKESLVSESRQASDAPLLSGLLNTPKADYPIQIMPQNGSLRMTLATITQARQGIATSKLREIGTQLELPVRELATLLATTERTLARRLESKDGELNKVESERLLLLQRLTEHGVVVFEDQGKFNRWLRRPLPLLDGQSPLELLDTASGFQVVDELLGRIEYGVYS